MPRSQDIFFSAKHNGILAVGILAIGIVHHASEKALLDQWPIYIDKPWIRAPLYLDPIFFHFHAVVVKPWSNNWFTFSLGIGAPS